MRVTALQPQTDQNRLDRSVHRAEKRGSQAATTTVGGLIRPTPGVCATADTTRGEKHLSNGLNQAILQSSCRPRGEYRCWCHL
jgi:hypothetical protein